MKDTLRNLLIIALMTLLVGFIGGGSQKEKLLQRYWKFDGMEVGNQIPLSKEQLREYMETNYFQFNKNGYYDMILMTEKASGKWKLMENETRLLLDGGTPRATIFAIEKLSEKELVLSQTDKENGAVVKILYIAK